MSRRPSPEEEHLWRSVTRQVAGVDHGRVRRLSVDEKRLWLAATGQAVPARPTPVQSPAPAAARPAPQPSQPTPAPVRPAIRPPGPSEGIEPNRHRRIARERDPIEARIDLHGLDQDQARAALERFVGWAFSQHYRAVLVITGKGLRGDGVLRQRTPEWLLAGPLRSMVAGLARADRRHGGEGAFYVALKRRR